MHSLTAPVPLAGKVVAARRLAAGFPVAAVARAANRTIETLEELLKDESFQRLVGGWDEIFSLAPEARTRRLVRLAHSVLEEAILKGNMRTSFLLVALDQQRRDPVVELAESLRKVGEREIRRAERLRASAAMPPAAGPVPAPDAGTAAAEPQVEATQAEARTRPDMRPEPKKIVDAVCWRQAAQLRAAMVGEQGLMAPPPAMAGLQAEAAALRAGQARAAEAAAPPEPAASPAPPPTTQLTEEQENLEAQFAEEFAQLPPETQAKLATFSQEDMNRLFEDLMRIELQRMLHEAESATGHRQDRGSGWPEGP